MSAIPGESGCWPRPNLRRKYYSVLLPLPLSLPIAAFITTTAMTFVFVFDKEGQDRDDGGCTDKRMAPILLPILLFCQCYFRNRQIHG